MNRSKIRIPTIKKKRKRRSYTLYAKEKEKRNKRKYARGKNCGNERKNSEKRVAIKRGNKLPVEEQKTKYP